MGRFLLVGTGPLLDEGGTTRVSGQCLRTLHFAVPMIQAGHRVDILTVPIPGTEPKADGELTVERIHSSTGIKYKSFTGHSEEPLVHQLASLLAEHQYDGVVGVNAYPAFLLARAKPNAPFWADLNGWTMAEGQTHAARVGNDWTNDHFWRMEVATLLEADRLSTVSDRQVDALFGELALVGRLNSLTFDWPFGVAVPNAVYPTYRDMERSRVPPPSIAHWPTDAHVVLWSGGYNTWTDVELLADGLARAMAEEPRLHFASTGGAIPGHDEISYERFQSLAARKLPPQRVALLGWIDTDEVLALHSRADVGINIDARNTETRFGARNRLTNMLGCGMPVVTTEGTEIAEWIRARDAGAVTPLGDAASLADALVDSARSPGLWGDRAARARDFARKDFAPAATLVEFLRWCERPNRAPDHPGAAPTGLRDRARDARALEARRLAELKIEGGLHDLYVDRASLAALRRKLPLRLWYALKKMAGR